MFLILNGSVISDVLTGDREGVNHRDPADGEELEASWRFR